MNGSVPPHLPVLRAAEDYLDGELLAACSDNQGYNAAGLLRSQVCVGSEQWCISTKSDRFSKLEQDVKDLQEAQKTVENQIASLCKDAVEDGRSIYSSLQHKRFCLLREIRQKATQIFASTS